MLAWHLDECIMASRRLPTERFSQTAEIPVLYSWQGLLACACFLVSAVLQASAAVSR